MTVLAAAVAAALFTAVPCALAVIVMWHGTR